MSISSYAQTYTTTVRDEATARTVADRLAARGHRLVAVRIMDHFSFDPSSFWYGKPSMRLEYSGWWDVFSLVLDPPTEDASERLIRWEAAAVATIAREHGGVASGPGGGHADTVLRNFTRVGLIHDLDAKEAEQRRQSMLEGAPTPEAAPAPARGLRYLAKSRGRSEVLAVVEVAGLLIGGETPDPVNESDDVTELLADLFDEAMHQDTCYPWTASRVPLFAELARDDRLTDYHRARLMTDLYMIATVGRRHLAYAADGLHAQDEPAVEAPDTLAARAAVAASLPATVTRASESELTRFMCAAIAAACPEAATGLIPILEALVRQFDGTSRAPVAALMYELAVEDQAAVGAALGKLTTTAPEAVDGLESPYARIEHKALEALGRLLTTELDHSTA